MLLPILLFEDSYDTATVLLATAAILLFPMPNLYIFKILNPFENELEKLISLLMVYEIMFMAFLSFC